MTKHAIRLAMPLLGLSLIGCSGSVGPGRDDPSGDQPGDMTDPRTTTPGDKTKTPSSGDGKTSDPSKPTVGTPGGGTVDPDAAGPMPLVRLSNEEYDATVRDLLGDTTTPSRGFPLDGEGSSGYNAPAPIDAQTLRAYQQAAENLAPAAIAKLATLFPCDTAGGKEDACADAFITGFGKRVYRRPIAADEAAELKGVYTSARNDLKYGHPDALRLVLTTMLESPYFLYHWELGGQTAKKEGGKDAKVVRLNAWELASRLSYFFWASMPDADLFAVAESGKLLEPAELEKQARRLLSDKRAKQRLASFHTQWLQIDDIASVQKNNSVYKSFNSSLAASMNDETVAFVQSVFDGDGKLSSLFNSPVAFMNQSLASVYGVSGVKGTTATKVMLDPAQRSGILTRTSFLATHAATNGSNPVKRGKVIFFRLLCGNMPPPPNDVPAVKPPADNMTTRQRFSEHSTNPTCAACHKTLDPLGFPFESFDGIGQYRTMEGTLPVDTKGSVTLPKSGTKSYADAREMSALLADADEVKDCMTRQWSRYLLRRMEVPEDEASIQDGLKAFAASGYDLRELMVGLTKTRTFQYRAIGAGEVTQ